MQEEKYTIPFEKIMEAIEIMNYGSPERVMFEMLALTGCRISELDNMKFQNIFGDYICWNLGKNQKGSRKEHLPEYYLNEIVCMRKKYKCNGQLFPICANTFVRYFNRDVRPKLSPQWKQKTINFSKKILRQEHIYKLKSLRKNYQTLVFKKFLDKFKGHYDIALQFTSKRMKHSSTRMTAYHYLQGLDEIKKFDGLMPEQILQTKLNQKRLIEFI